MVQMAGRLRQPLVYLLTDVSVVNVDGDKANIFGDYFSMESDEEFNELPHRCSASQCDEMSFSDEIIIDKLKNLKVNKSPGPDTLHPRIWVSLESPPTPPTVRGFGTFFSDTRHTTD